MFALRQTRFRVWEIRTWSRSHHSFTQRSIQHVPHMPQLHACAPRAPAVRKRGYERSSAQNMKTLECSLQDTSQGSACHGVHRDTVNANDPSGTFSLGPARGNGSTSIEQELLGAFEKLCLTVGGSQLSLIHLMLNPWANLVACERKSGRI